MNWQPIETFPKIHGKTFLFRSRGWRFRTKDHQGGESSNYHLGRWDRFKNAIEADGSVKNLDATHWAHITPPDGVPA
jgi:hypothetical protein